MNMFYTDTIPQ